MKVKTIVLALIIIACVFNSSCALLDDHLTKEDIINVVNGNKELLDKVPGEIRKLGNKSLFISTTHKRPIENEDPFGEATVSFPSDYEGVYLEVINENETISFSSLKNDVISKVLNIKGIMGIDYWASENRFSISFDCGGEGFGSATSDFGFYYTEDNMPIGLDGDDVTLTKSGSGWTWQDEEGSDNIYYTEKIIDNWFYFRMNW